MSRNKRFMELNRKAELSIEEAEELQKIKEEIRKAVEADPLPELSPEDEVEVEKELRRRGWA